jgi:hypothetical protein
MEYWKACSTVEIFIVRLNIFNLGHVGLLVTAS